jgi:predicted nucleic acid-binding Zn finger protein
MTIETAKTHAPGVRFYYVTGDSGNKYVVAFVRRNHQCRWFCECKDFMFRQIARKRHCKHIRSIRESLRISKSECAQ